MGSSNGGLSAIRVSVLSDVMNETQRRQVPSRLSALIGRLYFNQAAERRDTLQGLQSQKIPEEQSACDRQPEGRAVVARRASPRPTTALTQSVHCDTATQWQRALTQIASMVSRLRNWSESPRRPVVERTTEPHSQLLAEVGIWVRGGSKSDRCLGATSRR